MTDHDVAEELRRLVVQWLCGDELSTGERLTVAALRRELDRRRRKGLWRGCTCEECFLRVPVFMAE